MDEEPVAAAAAASAAKRATAPTRGGSPLSEEHLDIVRRRFADDRFAGSLGIELEALSEDRITMRMVLREDMLNWFGRPHGAAIYTLADAAFSVLTNNKNNLSVALDCSITYHAGAEVGEALRVEGEELAITGKTAGFLFKVFVERDDGDLLIATMKSVAYRTGRPIQASSGPSEG
jgi:acyl-CoA thioesterase